MDAENKSVAQMKAVTISREYGSGGGEVAARTASRLGWQLIDHEIVAQVAQRLHISEKEAEDNDEYAESLTERIFQSLQLIQPTMPVTVPIRVTVNSLAFHEARCRILEAAAAKGHVVIVGRGAQALFAKQRDMLHIRIVAPLEARIAYVMQRENLSREDARARIQQKDQDRIRYLQIYYRKHPADAHLYDLVLNTAILDLESVVAIIYRALEAKAKRLSLATGELGAVQGLPPYPGLPGDIRPPESAESSSI
ncbi:cytidylate kinase-like family protein [Ktedonosporobacter rubrisoli]|uniref:Cytidylate kinase-like family protein n=1 Tax=Ktedonosporobacter rubrisoli TaxID=2509675 RepID=A0A4P6JT69_KTERU|nr:cytidylate kinase-like family protein [Ktedonosporobacter rubrisoli]QBD78493.1 cytidylate kinase-like family protein [Ktedonosporobacter rubrisoli]